MGKYSKVKSKPVKKRDTQNRGNKILKILVWALSGILLALIVFRLFFMPGILYNLQYNGDVRPPHNTQPDEITGNETTAPAGNTEPQQGGQTQNSGPTETEGTSQPGQTDPAPSETTTPADPSETTAPSQPKQTDPAPSETTAPADPSETTAPSQPKQTDPAPSETTAPTGPSETTAPSQPGQTGQTPNDSTVPTSPAGTTPPSQAQQSVAGLPAMLDCGLKLENMFQFSGMNPDAGNQEGTDIATILLKNTSGTYLAKADLTITLTDGKKLTFTVTNLPSGQSAMAFSKENASIGANATCRAVSYSTSFVPDLNPIPAKISVSTVGTKVTLTNNSDQALTNLVVYCRCPLGEEYFGGISYQYIVKNIPPRGTATVNAVDCILGMTEVVCVEVNKE